MSFVRFKWKGRAARRVAAVGMAALMGIAAVHGAEIDFAHEVAPILRKHCVECHGGEKAKGGFSINTRELFLDDDRATPGKADQSLFIKLIRSTDPEERMPPEKKPRLTSAEVDMLTRWVDAGMPWDAGFSFALLTYEPPLKPRRPKLPPIVDGRANPVDRILDAWLAERSLTRPAPITDAQFLRRASLDLIGLPPTPDELDAFLADPDSDKRAKAIRRLLDDEIGYADHWLTFWNDLLRNDYTGTGFITGGRKQISEWLYAALTTNMPFDQFVRELIAPPTEASKGYIDGIKWRGTVSAGQSVEIQFAQSVSQSFLGINLKCASCHDSFIDRWKLDESYGMAAIYSTRPLEIFRCDKPVGREAKAAWLFPELGNIDPKAEQPERLKQLASLMTHPDNGRTTRTIVNRLWAQLMGRGIVHPLDAMQTAPWSIDLLDFLGVYLTDHGYDLKAILELIATSEAYQSRCEILADGSDVGKYVYQGPRARRMTAEQFVDSLWLITGAAPGSYDAPVFRGRVDKAEQNAMTLNGRWIWGASGSEGKASPAGEEILLRKVFKLDDDIARGGAVMTCDNSFVLYINGREVMSGDDWTKPHSVALNGRLKKGSNQFVLRTRNAGKAPNLAGLYFEANLRLNDGRDVVIASGPDWQWNPRLPNSREGRLGSVGGKWEPAVVVAEKPIWNEAVSGRIKAQLAIVARGKALMTRASLVKSDFFMRSLGRPMREQIVSSRPSELGALAAIDLHNNAVFADSLGRGGRRLAASDWAGADELADYLFQFALARKPTAAERGTVREALGDKPKPESVEDLLWALFLNPEFMTVR